jgi:fatty acid desaturase
MLDSPLTEAEITAASADSEQDLDAAATSAATEAYLSPRQVFSSEGLEQLTQSSNFKGAMQLALHLTVLGASGYCWMAHLQNLWIGLPALVIYGFCFALMFSPMHECSHRTAFASNWMNDSVGWFAGLLSLYNSDFYRRYHKWHHRYANIPGKDPELSDPLPTDLPAYLWHTSGIPWWIGKLKCHFLCATDQMEEFPYISPAARSQVQRSVQAQLLVYGLAIALSVYVQYPWFILGWLLPLAIGQPFLRMVLLSEHTGCNQDENPFANTRTTLAWKPMRQLIWNISYHAEHHFCPAIPFHALPAAHEKLRPHLSHVDPGYIAVNLNIIQNFNA